MKVFVQGSQYEYEGMFLNRGWSIAQIVEEADLIQLTGGADINPDFYGKHRHPRTYTDNKRDEDTWSLFRCSQVYGIPIAGICRGAQFLHAMAGGQLVQDCDNHAVNYGHKAKLSWMPNTEVLVSSTHHQMMYSEDVGEVLMWSDALSTRKETMLNEREILSLPLKGQDIEAMYYEHINAVSFQPHPEFSNGQDELKDCQDCYFFILNNYLNVGV